MTIDINKLRRLAQAATPGPWYATGKLTRYVEARIDGGLIQEVAACGPTKADGGYGPQQEANASLIAAANPATISELLDRLEAVEKERRALRAALQHETDCVEAAKAEIAAMNQQEPVGYVASLFDESVIRINNFDRASPVYLAPGAQPTPSVPEDWDEGGIDAFVQKEIK